MWNRLRYGKVYDWEVAKWKIIFISVFVFAAPILTSAHVAGVADPFYRNVSSAEHLREHYKEGDLRILLVPGHGKSEGGTQFADFYERDLNVLIAHKLARLLETD